MKNLNLRGRLFGLSLLAATGVAQADFIGTHVNGFYYEGSASTARRGLGVHYLPTGPESGVLFAAYYTYDEDTGAPIWVQGARGVRAGDFQAEINLEFVEGGSFGATAGNPVGTPVWGKATITFNSCNSVTWAISDSDFDNFENDQVQLQEVLGFTPAVPNSQCVYQSEFAGCPDWADEGLDPRTCVIPAGEITEDRTLTNDTIWFLEGATYIGARDTTENTNTLTIEPGTRIVGANGDTLLGIQRGAKIMAEGTPNFPIVLTGPCRASEATESCPDGGQPAQWGGVTVNGKAPLNTCGTPGECTSEGEGQSGTYGGADAHDNSGVIRYVRIQFAGFRFLDTNELNGIALQGVGDGTVLENIQVHANEDDGIEFFGGTVNARNIVITGAKDDSLDWTEGWNGRLQNLLVVQDRNFEGVELGDKGIEADNLEANNDATPRAQPRIANATFLGRPETTAFNLRRGTGANLSNIIVTGFSKGIDIDSTATFTAAGSPGALTGVLTMENSILDNTTNFTNDGSEPWTDESWFTGQTGNSEAAVNLEGVFPPADATYLSGYPLDREVFDAFFQDYGHIGAFGAGGASTAWTQGWTLQELDNWP